MDPVPGHTMPQVVAPAPPSRGFMPVPNPGTVQLPGMGLSQPPSPPTQSTPTQPALTAPAPPPTVQTADTSNVPGNCSFQLTICLTEKFYLRSCIDFWFFIFDH